MTTYLTPAEFMAQPVDPDEDGPDFDPEETLDPLASIAASLRILAGQASPTSGLGAAELEEDVQSLRTDLVKANADGIELAERCDDLERRLDEVRALIKPSTSKLANAIRAVLDPVAPAAVTPEPVGRPPAGGQVEPNKAVYPTSQPGPTPDDEPAPDADVEEWRAYARELGYTEAVNDMNRSQIRTLIGHPHPLGAGS